MKTIKINFITICMILLPVYVFSQTTVKKVSVEKPTNTVPKPGSSSARIKEIATQILVKNRQRLPNSIYGWPFVVLFVDG